MSGGSDRTTFFLSGAYSYDRGIVVGPNNKYRRIAVRFNGSQLITDDLKVSGNVSYVDGSGGFIETRNTTGGLLLGAWRTTPAFNNLPYFDPTFGLHRSYRFPNPGPGSETSSRIYNNPFFTANENPISTNVGRTFGGISAEWSATSWLKVAENLGLDYSNDERFQAWARSNSEGAPPSGVQGVGGVNAGYIKRTSIDHNLTATVELQRIGAAQGYRHHRAKPERAEGEQPADAGAGLTAPQPFKLSNTGQLLLPAYDFESRTRLESYFGQATLDIGDRIFLTAALRNDGASTFGSSSRHNWFPKASAAWVFYRPEAATGALTYGKLRLGYGQSGTQPQPYLLSGTFVSQTINDGAGVRSPRPRSGAKAGSSRITSSAPTSSARSG